jgi:hypothetical protein
MLPSSAQPDYNLLLLADSTLQPIKKNLNETFFKAKFLNQTFNFEELRGMAKD